MSHAVLLKRSDTFSGPRVLSKIASAVSDREVIGAFINLVDRDRQWKVKK